MRLLWQGGYQTHRGKHYTVENARIFDVPDEPVEVAVAAMQPVAAELAGRIGDAFVNTSPDRQLVERFEASGGGGKPKYGQVTVCWAESKDIRRGRLHARLSAPGRSRSAGLSGFRTARALLNRPWSGRTLTRP